MSNGLRHTVEQMLIFVSCFQPQTALTVRKQISTTKGLLHCRQNQRNGPETVSAPKQSCSGVTVSLLPDEGNGQKDGGGGAPLKSSSVSFHNLAGITPYRKAASFPANFAVFLKRHYRATTSSDLTLPFSFPHHKLGRTSHTQRRYLQRLVSPLWPAQIDYCDKGTCNFCVFGDESNV